MVKDENTEQKEIEVIIRLDKEKDIHDVGNFCIEEMAELTKALCKLKRGGSLHQVFEELSHVLLTADLLVLKLDCEKEVAMYRRKAIEKRIGKIGEKGNDYSHESR